MATKSGAVPMRFFVYEFVTGGGWWSVDNETPPDNSLRREGAAMRRALLEDCGRVGDVVTLSDARLVAGPLPGCDVRLVENAVEERRQFVAAAREADWTIVVAPEFHGLLTDRARWVEEAGGRLLSPHPEFIEIAADKHRTAQRLRAAGVPAPRNRLLPSGLDVESCGAWITFPGIVKPRDGAGSESVYRVESMADLRRILPSIRDPLWEEFCPGIAASIGVLGCVQEKPVQENHSRRNGLPLRACLQELSADGRFRYLGGKTLPPGELAERADCLARRVAGALPPTTGYWGIDLVLGDDRNGARDFVIEVNPRLTTSYLGLRQRSEGNLVAAMLQGAEGEGIELRFRDEPVQFGP